MYHFVTLLLRDLYCYYRFPEEDKDEYANTTMDRLNRCSELLGTYNDDWKQMFMIALNIRFGVINFNETLISNAYSECITSVNTILKYNK